MEAILSLTATIALYSSITAVDFKPCYKAIMPWERFSVTQQGNHKSPRTLLQRAVYENYKLKYKKVFSSARHFPYHAQVKAIRKDLKNLRSLIARTKNSLNDNGLLIRAHILIEMFEKQIKKITSSLEYTQEMLEQIEHESNFADNCIIKYLNSTQATPNTIANSTIDAFIEKLEEQTNPFM